MSRFLRLACLLLAFLIVESPSRAAEDADALIQRGIELRKQGQDDAALVEFRRAYSIAKTPRAAAQLGFVEQALGSWADAQGHVEEALAAPQDPWIVKNRNVIETSLRTIQEHTARIDVNGGVDGASVEVDGRAVGKLPLPESIRVNAGTVDIVVRANGYRPAIKNIVVAPNSRTKIHFVLEADRSADPLAGASDGNSGVLTHPAPINDRSEGPGRGLRITGISIGAAGVALLGAGLACTLTANSKLDGLNADAAAGRPYNESNGNWQTFRNASIALYVTGGVAALGGAMVFYLGSHRQSGEGVPVAMFFAPTPNGVALAGLF